MFTEQKIEWTKTGPWKFYNYALAHCRGIAGLFDLMRYESAYLLRRSDVDQLLKSANDQLDFVLQRLTMMLCKHDDRGITKPSWVMERLQSSMELEFIDDHENLFVLASGLGRDVLFHAKPPHRWKGEIEVSGNLSQVLSVMFNNLAFPAHEGDSHHIEQAFHHPNEIFTTKIAAFFATDKEKFKLS